MKWSSAVSENFSLAEAVGECSRQIHDDLDGMEPDLIFAFVSSHHAVEYESLPQLVRENLADALLIGCSGGGIIGAGREIEQRPGFALTAAVLPDVQLTPFYIGEDALPDGDAPPDQWEALLGVKKEVGPHFVILADPFSTRGEQLLMGLDYAFPDAVKIGGLASGANQPGGNSLYLDPPAVPPNEGRTYRGVILGKTTYDSGAVGVALSGDIAVDSVVAQGCRPIGDPMQVTSCSRNLLLGLDGRTPFEVLKEVFQGLDERDRELAQNSLFIGVVMDPFNDSPQLGDFLIRNIVGIDAQKGLIAVGEMLKEGQTIQFHLRDSQTSSQDLDAMLEKYVSGHQPQADSGALLFQCLGRGAFLYGRADHDTDMFREKVGALPLTGFFCNGEIGPVGGSTFLHGYTSSFGIFRPKEG